MLPTPKPSTKLLVCDPEVRSVYVSATEVSEQTDILCRLERFSSWITLLYVFARIKRFGSKFKHVDLVTMAEHRRATER